MSENPKLLVVDDEQVICQACRRIFSRQGFQVEESTDACQGLARAKQQDYAAVLLDIKMPKLDGIEFLEKLREEKPELPVLIMTGYPSIPNATAAIRLGASDYITKPFTPEEITKAVQRMLAPGVLKTRQQEAAASGSGPETPAEQEFLFLDEACFQLEADGSACVSAVLPRLQGATLAAVRLPRIGEVVYQGLPLAAVRTADKFQVIVPSAISGVVVAVNELLTTDPSVLLKDPCGQGWIACLCTTRFEEEMGKCKPRRLILLNPDGRCAQQQRQKLQSLGCAVRAAAGWEDMAPILPGFACDVVLLDAAALGQRGPELVARINAQMPALRVVVLASSEGRGETAYRQHRIFYYAVEPFADNEIVDILDAAFRPQEPQAPPEKLTRGPAESLGSVCITNRNERKVRLLAAPGLLRRFEGLGGRIAQKLGEKMFSVEATPGDAGITPHDIVKAAHTCDRLMVLLAKDSGLLPGALARDIKAEFVSASSGTSRVTTLLVQPDALGGLAALDARTTDALAEHIVREMASY
jgi:DNA-binding response OmpR family regulator/glycine cleavage system H lipoate-binding protein